MASADRRATRPLCWTAKSPLQKAPVAPPAVEALYERVLLRLTALVIVPVDPRSLARTKKANGSARDLRAPSDAAGANEDEYCEFFPRTPVLTSIAWDPVSGVRFESHPRTLGVRWWERC